MDTSCGNSIMQNYELFDRMMKRVNTCIPGQIVSFNPGPPATCSVIPAIKMRTFVGGVSQDVQLPTLDLVPVMFMYSVGAGLAMTFPVNTGDPCMIYFSQRSIDNWWTNGGIQSPDTGGIGARHHDINDAFVQMMLSPAPAGLQGWNNSAFEIRNLDRTVRITLTVEGTEINGPVNFLSPVTFQAPVTLNSTFTDSNGIEHTEHIHGGVKAGSDNTGAPEL
jgi:hypothetical protein